MRSEELFAMGLGLSAPWEVSEVKFERGEGGSSGLHIYIDFHRGSKFMNDAGQLVSAYDTEEKQWRHMNFFEHKCFLHCRVPRIRMKDGCVRMAEVPWARPGSGFTMLFEAFAMKLVESEMPVSSVSKRMRVSAPRIWRIFHHWVGKARNEIDLSAVSRIGVDETSSRKGHNYITNFVDLDTKRLIFASEGRGEETFGAFVCELERRGGRKENISVVSMDMSPAFISGYFEHFSHASLVFDRFHIVKMLNKAMDDTRKAESKDKRLLKGHRFTLLRRMKNLPAKKRSELETLMLTYPQVGEAYKYKEGFLDVFTGNMAPKEAIDYIDKWCKAVMNTSLLFMKKFVATIRAHWSGIISTFSHPGVNNGILEGMNLKIQLAKRRARGFANINNFIDMAYLTCGRLNLDYPHDSL